MNYCHARKKSQATYCGLATTMLEMLIMRR